MKVKKSRIFGFVAILFVIIFIISIFVPYYSSAYGDYSLWTGEGAMRIPFLIGGILMLIIFLINVRTEITYLFSGSGLFFCIDKLVTVSSSSFYYNIDVFGVGFWLLFISSIIIIILTFIMNFKIFDSKIGSKKTNSTSLSNNSSIAAENTEVVGYDSKTGKPIIGYNPMTGEPIFKEEPKKVNIVGYDPMNGKPIVGYDAKTGMPIYME